MAVEKWTLEMLDELGYSIKNLRESISYSKEGTDNSHIVKDEVQGSISDPRKGIRELRETVEDLKIQSLALLKLPNQNPEKMNNFEEEMKLKRKKWEEEQKLWEQQQKEKYKRFDALLEEIHYLIHKEKKNPENEQ